MIEKNSGKFFRLKLDFNLGFGFAEVYDFTVIHSFDGTKVFVYNRIDINPLNSYDLSHITGPGIGLGPLSMASYPNRKGNGAWKFLFKSDNYFIEEPPITKVGNNAPWNYDWNELEKWHRSDDDFKTAPGYVYRISKFDRLMHGL